MRPAREIDLTHQIAAAKRGDELALDFLRTHGPHGRALERIRELQHEIDETRAALARLPEECREHLDHHGGGGEAWVDTCVLCGRTEVS